MVKFFDATSQSQIKNAMGEIRLISPSGKEHEEAMTNYGGILAANFTFDEKGKYGVICLFKVDGKKRLVKFWYPSG
jgi:antitoxin component YwqK of YwqJK toxin-antitoxin module